MGEVYRAFDTRLHREVAVKVLPAALADHPERVVRLEREARLLAALNHPHIATIHGLEMADGVPALVMELIVGPTLADRLAGGRLALAETLAIARQIAAALEAAHEKGIIHRDLKPANIKITETGTVKVLDFGLATALDPDQHEVAAGSGIPTPERGIAGTPAYMSPEQVRGGSIDRRVLRRCLDKDPRRRLHDIADARIEVEDAVDDLEAFESTLAPASNRRR